MRFIVAGSFALVSAHEAKGPRLSAADSCMGLG